MRYRPTCQTVADDFRFEARKAGLTVEPSAQLVVTKAGHRMLAYVWRDPNNRDRYATATIGCDYSNDATVFRAAYRLGSDTPEVAIKTDKFHRLWSVIRTMKVAS